MTTESTTAALFVNAEPYAWPWNGNLRPDNTALIVIDMQVDF
ncbi:MAG: cysteine hydrolase, partial [Pseudomonadota bacterium]